MRRQGFYPEEIGRLAAVLKEKNLKPAGIYTHFAAAKDAARLAPTEKQFRLFRKPNGRCAVSDLKIFRGIAPPPERRFLTKNTILTSSELASDSTAALLRKNCGVKEPVFSGR